MRAATRLLTPSTSQTQEPIRWMTTGAGSQYPSTGSTWLEDIPSSSDALVVTVFMENTTLTPQNVAATTGWVGDSSRTLSVLSISPAIPLPSGYLGYIVMLGILNPPTGLGLTISVTNPSAYTAASSMAYSGVGSFGTVAGEMGLSGNPQFFVSAAEGDMVVAALSGYTAAITGFNQNMRYTAAYGPNVNLALVIGDAFVPQGSNGVLFSADNGAATAWGTASVRLRPRRTSRLIAADPPVTNQYFDNYGKGSLVSAGGFGTNTSTGFIDIAPDVTFALLIVGLWIDNSLTVSNGGIGGVSIPGPTASVVVGSGLACYYLCLQNPPTGINVPFTWTAGGFGNTYVFTNVITFRRIASLGTAVTKTGSGTDLLHATNGQSGQIFVQTFMTRDVVSYWNYTPKERFRAQEAAGGGFTNITGEGAAGSLGVPITFSAKANPTSLWGSIILPLNTL